MTSTYSRFYMSNRTDLFKEVSGTYKQLLLREGDCSDANLYLVYEGEVLLQRRMEVSKGVFKMIRVALLQPGHTFNEQAVFATHNNLLLEDTQPQRTPQAKLPTSPKTAN